MFEKVGEMEEKTQKTMRTNRRIEENGHRWIFFRDDSDARCVFCAMKYSYYLHLKKCSEEQPEREDLKEWMKCKRIRGMSVHKKSKTIKDPYKKGTCTWLAIYCRYRRLNTDICEYDKPCCFKKEDAKEEKITEERNCESSA